jgi:hypothetical protein
MAPVPPEKPPDCATGGAAPGYTTGCTTGGDAAVPDAGRAAPVAV